MIGMTDSAAVARQFVAALAAHDAAQLAAVLTDDAALLVHGLQGEEAYRPRDRVIGRLTGEWAAWPDPQLELFTVLSGGAQVAVEFRIQATEGDRYVEHNRAALLTVQDARVQIIYLYCPEPIPSARRKGWIAPATLSDDAINRLFETLQYTFDVREWMPHRMQGYRSRQMWEGGTGDPHPGSNEVGGVRWTADEADARIAAKIDEYRRQGRGFTWFVGSYDTPPDLGARLERHGMVPAGDQAMMARVGLDNLDIPTNPEMTVEVLDGSDDAALEAAYQIGAAAFNWTPEQIADRRPMIFARVKDPAIRAWSRNYLARIGGVPVAEASLNLRNGIAYLAGASTLPAYRNRRIYSTLLRRRLEDARAAGYHIAAIHAEPMSRRVVSRYGFKEYARVHMYAWMPVIDMEVIRLLVPDE
jgi:hypothetical protein